MLFASWQVSLTTNIIKASNSYVLLAVAAAVIGGTSLFGGRGKTIHGVLGGLVIGGIYNGLYLLGVSSQWIDVVVAGGPARGGAHRRPLPPRAPRTGRDRRVARAAPCEVGRASRGAAGTCAFACLSILLMGAAAGCSGGSRSAPGSGDTTSTTAYGVEDPTSVSCPSASFCMAVLESGYAATYDGTTWSRPARLSSSAGEPDSVSCPTVSFCMAVDARDSSAFVFNGSTWSSAPSINDPVLERPTGHGIGIVLVTELLRRR